MDESQGVAGDSGQLDDHVMPVDAAAGDAVGEADAGVAPEACTSYAGAYCAQLKACVPIAFRSAWYGSLATCASRVAVECANEVAAPGTALTAPGLTMCSQAISAQTCSEFLTALPGPCQWHGSLGNDAGCEYSSQCQSSLCRRTAGWCGTCVNRGKVGDPCGLDINTCQPGLICTGNGACATPVLEGGTCPDVTYCLPTLVCEQTTCSAGIAEGQACPDQHSCAGETFCGRPDAGTSGQEECLPVGYAGIGQPCVLGGGVFCDYGECFTEAGSPYGTCVALAADGQVCNGDYDCQRPSLCVGGVCKGPAPAASCGR
jgi:hypothetical protein